jgi:hypothetical protein
MASIYLNNPTQICELEAADMSDENFHRSLKTIATHMVPSWAQADQESIAVSPLTGGISNMLFVLTSGVERLIIRLFGNGTELFISRDVENKVFTRLSTLQLAPTFHGLFVGGRVEGYIDAKALEPDEMSVPEVFMKVSKVVAQLHSVNMDIIDSGTCLWAKVDSFFDLTRGL